jgi:hypothetical protein
MPKRKRINKVLVSILVVCNLQLHLAAQVQTGGSPPGPDAAISVQTLRVLPLQGDQAVNIVRTTVFTPVVVEVRDADDRPVEGATVTFELPPMGPGGYFAGQALTQSVRTNYRGQAAMSGFRPNSEAGRFTIKVTARRGNEFGATTVQQTNATTMESAGTRGRFSRKWLLISAVAGTGVGLGLYFGTRNGSSPVGPTVGLVPGSVTIGGPR